MGRAKMTRNFPELIGKKIVRACYLQPDKEKGSQSPTQLILEFEDRTFYEIYTRGAWLAFTGRFSINNHVEKVLGAAEVNKQNTVFTDGETVIFSDDFQ